MAEDVSLGGLGVVVPVGRGEWLRVGMRLTLRTETDSAWGLGVMRRVKADEHRQHRIGVQLISKSPVALMLRRLAVAARGRKAHGAPLLLARPSPNGSAHLVASRGLLTGREAPEASYGKPPVKAQFDGRGVVESGHDFGWLRYKLLDRKSTRLNSSHIPLSRMPSSA